MKKPSLLIFFLLFVFSSILKSNTITLTPIGGGANDATQIQNSLNTMAAGDSIQLNGAFTIKNTIFLPSNIKWFLSGSITLGAGGTWTECGWVGTVSGVPIDATRATAITEKNWNTTGSSGIEMTGGTYDGNYALNGTSRIRMMNFVRLTNSKFNNMVCTKAADDNFTLGPGCLYNECRNLVSSYAGIAEGDQSGNALTDKGNNNKWYDCIAENCTSDGFTPKCSNSEYYRCIARGNKGPGWGMFCRLDGASVDVGTAIDNNLFMDCEAYDNMGAGFSFNVSSTCGTGGSVRNNYIQAKCYNNQESGVRFRNKMPGNIVADNEVDILCYGNRGLNKTGDSLDYAGGLSTVDNSDSPVTGVTGALIAYSNSPQDVGLGDATGCNIAVYRPSEISSPVIDQGTSNTVTVTNFSCTETLTTWCQRELCGATDIKATGVSILPTTVNLNINASQQLIATISPTNAVNKTVLWSTSNGAIATVSSNGLVKAIAPGTVTITATTQVGNLKSTSTINVSTNTDVENIYSDTNKRLLNIYPNPASQSLIIQTAKNDCIVQVNIYSMQGQLVKTYNQTSTLDISTIPVGMYIVEIHNNNEIIKKKVLVKRKKMH